MSLEIDSEFRNEQERLLDSARRHFDRGLVASVVAGGAMVTGAIVGILANTSPVVMLGGTAVVGLEVVHQLVANGVDLRKHELNKRKHLQDQAKSKV